MALQRVLGASRKLHLACQGHALEQVLPGLSSLGLSRGGVECCPKCSCGASQVCMFHGSATASANPDNKPAPSDATKDDPTNTQQDALEHDPEDSEAYAPGYYDKEGVKGGHRRVASQEESKQVPKRKPDAEWQDYHPETKEDPNKPKPKDPNAADIPDYEAGIKGVRENPSPDSSADGYNPNRSPQVDEDIQVTGNQMPHQHTKLAGMPEPSSPPQSGTTPDKQAASTDSTSPFGNPTSTEDIEQPGMKILEEGAVKPGKPEAPPKPNLNN